jgi:anti-anti-sigma factor
VAESLAELLAEPGRETLVLDIRDVDFLASAEVAQLISLHNQARAAGGRLVLVNLNAHLYELFTRLKLHTFMDVRPREAA